MVALQYMVLSRMKGDAQDVSSILSASMESSTVVVTECTEGLSDAYKARSLEQFETVGPVPRRL